MMNVLTIGFYAVFAVWSTVMLFTLGMWWESRQRDKTQEREHEFATTNYFDAVDELRQDIDDFERYGMR